MRVKLLDEGGDIARGIPEMGLEAQISYRK